MAVIGKWSLIGSDRYTASTVLSFAMLHQFIFCTHTEAGVGGWSHARMLFNKEGYKLEYEKPLHRGRGGQNRAFFSVTYYLNDPYNEKREIRM